MDETDPRTRLLALHKAGRRDLRQMARDCGLTPGEAGGLIHRHKVAEGYRPISRGSNLPKDRHVEDGLPEDIVLEIRRRCGEGELHKLIAYDHEICRSLVSKIALFRIYKHVP